MLTQKSLPTSGAVSWWEVISLGLLATLLYLYVFGPTTLVPNHYAWMLRGDPAQHYLGWQFFRHEPWQWPLGQITGLGLPGGTGIVFTDSIPLLALFFKPFSTYLPADFQYFGLWMWACYGLTGYFGLKVLSNFTTSHLLRGVAASLFLLSPPLFLRGYGHEALMAQWLLLAGLHTYFGGWQWRNWLVLTLLAALIHPYLLLMILGLLLAANLQALGYERRNTAPQLLRQNTIIFVSLVAALFATGHLGIKGPLAGEGYGFFSMNMVSLIDPATEPNFGTGRFLIDLPAATQGQYEGFLYLGGGVIALGALALLLLVARSRSGFGPQAGAVPGLPGPVWPLAAVSAVFWALALSNQVTFASQHLFTVPLPQSLLDLLSIFRASGRLGWPAFYLLTLGILVVIVRYLPTRAALCVLLAAVLLQAYDLSDHYRLLRKAISDRTQWVTPLQSAQWPVLASQADTLLILPPHPLMEGIYIPFAHLAATYHLATNAAHNARSEPARMAAFGQGIAQDLAQGNYNPRTLYVMPQKDGLAHLPPVLAAQVLQLDGYYVLPPGLPKP